VFSAGDVVSIYNNSAASQTVTQGVSVTMYLAGTATTGNRTLAQRGVCTALCVATNTFVIAGTGLTWCLFIRCYLRSRRRQPAKRRQLNILWLVAEAAALAFLVAVAALAALERPQDLPSHLEQQSPWRWVEAAPLVRQRSIPQTATPVFFRLFHLRAAALVVARAL
jgi:hypothetical protein